MMSKLMSTEKVGKLSADFQLYSCILDHEGPTV